MIAPPIEPATVRRSQAHCRRLACSQADNFRYAMRLLPAGKRAAMYTLYAWMRLTDDIADGDDGRTVSRRIEDLENWRARTRAAVDGRVDHTAAPSIWPAFADMVGRYRVPPQVFEEAIEGQRQDLDRASFDTFAQLLTYCRRVAGTVGVASIHIWGFEGGARTIGMAEDRGVAFQLTNVLRDLREDLQRGRLYLPRQELDQNGVRESDLRGGGVGAGLEGFDRLMKLQICRARSYFERSAPLEALVAPDCRATLRAMTRIYAGLLEKIAARPRLVLRRRVSLSALTKLWIAGRAMLLR